MNGIDLAALAEQDYAAEERRRAEKNKTRNAFLGIASKSVESVAGVATGFATSGVSLGAGAIGQMLGQDNNGK